MKKIFVAMSLVVALAAGLTFQLSRHPHKWLGVDESVVEKFAAASGHPPRPPFINTDQGDLLLFCFLLAGTIGGFTAGYYFRTLFPPRVKPRKEPSDV